MRRDQGRHRRNSKGTIAVVAFLSLIATSASAQPCVEQTCPSMRTCAEAYYYFAICGQSRRDADGDGIPCENICGTTKQEMIGRLRAEPWPGHDFAGMLERGSALGLVPNPIGPHAGKPSSEPPSLTCGTKRTCREMTSCGEAKFYMEQCGLKRLDGDGDGIPCNNLCR